MHEYASSGRKASAVHSLLGLVSVGLSVAVGPLLARGVDTRLLYVTAPSAATFYGVLLWLYDKWLWRLGIGGCRLSCIADLRGTWVGSLESSENRDHQHRVSLCILQTWSRIRVTACTGTSGSVSVAAAVEPMDAATPGLTYTYRNDPGTFTPTKQAAHSGAAYLKLENEGRRLVGSYFTNRTPKQTKGEMRLERVSRKQLDHDAALSKLPAASKPNGEDEL